MDQEPNLPEPPSQPTPLTPTPVSTDWQTPGVLVLAGGILVLIGVFLPWVTASGPNGSASVSGREVSAWGFLLLGGFAVARGLSMARPDRFRFQLGTPLIGAAILAFLTISRWKDVQDTIDRLHALGFSASVGIGLWAVIAGTVLVAVGGLLSLQRR